MGVGVGGKTGFWQTESKNTDPVEQSHHQALKLSQTHKQDRRARGERRWVHHEGHQRHQKGSGIPEQGQKEEDHDPPVHDCGRQPGHVHRTQLHRAGVELLLLNRNICTNKHRSDWNMKRCNLNSHVVNISIVHKNNYVLLKFVSTFALVAVSRRIFGIYFSKFFFSLRQWFWGGALLLKVKALVTI